MRKNILAVVLILALIFSFVGCNSHKYSVQEIREKTGALELDSRSVYRGKEWGHVTYYFVKDSEEYSGVYFYLFDNSKEADSFYEFMRSGIVDNIYEEEDSYVIGESYGGEVIDKICVYVSDNMVVVINMDSTYFGEDGSTSYSSSHDENYVIRFVENW